MRHPKFSCVSARLLKFDGLVVAMDTGQSPGALLQAVKLSRPIGVFFHRDRSGVVYVAVGREPEIWPEDWTNDQIAKSGQ